jgi:dTDP-glucose pyrophosphorylase
LRLVLLTTSGLGSRLGEITKYTNKSLVRIDDKPAISHIIESYPKNTKFIITLGHFGSHVKQFLEIAYPEKDFIFVNVDNYQGPGSSLGYSILRARDYIDQPFIFNACDSILKDFNPENGNYVVGAKKQDYSQYRTFNVTDGVVRKINEKGDLKFDYAYTGVCSVENYKRFFEILSELENNIELSDVHVLNELMKEEQFSLIESKEWFDIGNSKELLNTRNNFKSSYEVLDKPQESIYFFDDYVIKFFSDSTISKNRVKRAEYLNGLVPNIVAHSENFYKYEKQDADLLAKDINIKSFLSLLDWSKTHLWAPSIHDNFDDLCFKFYHDKTYERVNTYLKNYGDGSKYINGIHVSHINSLLDLVDFDYLSHGTPVTFHGDFILDNILHDYRRFYLLDWRQDFQGCLHAGDVYYDLAKLNHNLILNHHVLNNELFTIEDGTHIKCDVLTPYVNILCQEKYHEWLDNNGFDVNKVKILTALIWINMAPLHEYPLSKFLFNFGKYNLCRELTNDL